MGVLIETYKRLIKGTVEDRANAKTLVNLARYRNRRSRDKLAGTFVPHAAQFEVKKELDFGAIVQTAEIQLEERPGRR